MKKHYIISDSGSIIGFTKEDYEMLPEKSRKLFEELGNHFETKKEAELVIEKLKALKRLKDIGFEISGFQLIEHNIHFCVDIEELEKNNKLYEDLVLLLGSEY